MAAGTGKKLVENVVKCILENPGYDKPILEKANIISAGEGKCEIELRVEQNLTNRLGSLHGGCTSTLVDAVSTLALMTYEGRGLPGVSVDMHIRYLKAAKMGEDIIIKAWTSKAGKTLAFLSVDILEKKSGTLIAQGSHTKFIGSNPATSTE